MATESELTLLVVWKSIAYGLVASNQKRPKILTGLNSTAYLLFHMLAGIGVDRRQGHHRFNPNISIEEELNSPRMISFAPGRPSKSLFHKRV